MSYLFNNMGRIGTDITDQSQTNVYNTRFANYTLSNYFSETASDQHVQFATQQPTLMFSGTHLGNGLSGTVVDTDTNLLYGSKPERSVEKLSLMQRPFITVPYLGRGSCDPELESQLLHGEMVGNMKSVSTIMEKSFAPYSLYPLDNNMQDRAQNPSYRIEEMALNGWTRGGNATRDMSTDEYLMKNSRPNSVY